MESEVNSVMNQGFFVEFYARVGSNNRTPHQRLAIKLAFYAKSYLEFQTKAVYLE